MGAGLSVTESVRTYAEGQGRCALSLEQAAAWTATDVKTALEAVLDSESCNQLFPVLEMAAKKADGGGGSITGGGGGVGGGGADGAFLLAASEEALEELFAPLSESLAAWATKAVLRLQRRQVIVGRDKRPPPLPQGWRAIASRSRPGEISFLNLVSGERTSVRPSKDATPVMSPLPAGWIEVPSSRWPGTSVYMHITNPNLRMKHRPRADDYTLAHDYGGGGGGGRQQQRSDDGRSSSGGGGSSAEEAATRGNLKKAVLRVMRGDLERKAAERRTATNNNRAAKQKVGFLHNDERLGRNSTTNQAINGSSSSRRGAGDVDEHHEEVHQEYAVTMLKPKEDARSSRAGSSRASRRSARAVSATSAKMMNSNSAAS